MIALDLRVGQYLKHEGRFRYVREVYHGPHILRDGRVIESGMVGVLLDAPGDPVVVGPQTKKVTIRSDADYGRDAENEEDFRDAGE